MACKYAILTFTLLALPLCAQAAGEDEAPQPRQNGWLDSSHSYVTNNADNLADWMNNFFGDVTTEQDAPYSTLRLRSESEWDEQDHFDQDLKLRGKVYLPNLNDRISLLFADEDTGETGRDDLLIDQRDAADDVSVQYRITEKERSDLDFRVGLRSSVNMKTSMRYRYKYPMSDTLLSTLSEEVLYLGGDGFGSRSRVEFDKILDERRVVQWHNRVDWQEDKDGLAWSSSLSLDKRLSSKKAFSYFVATDGETEPDRYVRNYVAGVRYRQNIYRKWLFVEVQPSYRWSKPAPDISREGAAVILFRLEAVFHRDLSEDL